MTVTLDPGVAAGTQAQTVRIQIMETLVQMNAETSDIEPLLAKQWEVADDKVTWTFHLRDGVTFHDGSPLTAADVVASIRRIINPEAGMGRANDLREIAKIEAVDDKTVRIVTAEPSGTLLRVLALDSASVLSAANGSSPPISSSSSLAGRVTVRSARASWRATPPPARSLKGYAQSG